jgi:site-specific recombinase XerD
MNTPTRSYAAANRQLVNAYERYLTARGNAAPTRRAYLDAVNRLVDSLGAASVVDVERSTIRLLMSDWLKKGLAESSIQLHTSALRSFYKFVRLSGLTRHDPMLLISYRKIPTRLPVVLTVEQVEKLIAAAQDHFERAVPEVLYATGCRVSELVNLRIEDINWIARTIRVHRGKGGKDRVVVFGSYAEEAMRAYLEWRPSRGGFLFEAPSRRGCVALCDRSRKGKSRGGSWYPRFYVNGVQRMISIGTVRDIPTKEQARQAFDLLASKIPGFQPAPPRPYDPVTIRSLLSRLAHRASLGRVHPHALRRAMASHFLQGGADLRSVQELLGHERLNSTMRYTWLDATHIKKVHEKCHPHEGGANAEKE